MHVIYPRRIYIRKEITLRRRLGAADTDAAARPRHFVCRSTGFLRLERTIRDEDRRQKCLQHFTAAQHCAPYATPPPPPASRRHRHLRIPVAKLPARDAPTTHREVAYKRFILAYSRKHASRSPNERRHFATAPVSTQIDRRANGDLLPWHRPNADSTLAQNTPKVAPRPDDKILEAGKHAEH